MNLALCWQAQSPAIRESLKSAAVASALGLQTAFLVLVGAAAQAGQVGTPDALWTYILGHWWGVVIGFILPAAYRARQGATAAQNTVTLNSGATAVITKGP